MDPYRSAGRNGGNYEGQLHLNGSYNEASEDGQAAFMHELHEAIASDTNILGYMYWDPIFVDQKVNNAWIKTCWAERYDATYDTWWEDGNVISNTTWFDYSGYPLKALWSEVASQVTPSGIESQELKAKSQKFIKDGQLFILRDGKVYNAQGAQVR